MSRKGIRLGPKTILVVMEGGVIQDVVGVPRGMRVGVRDYDVEGVDLDNEDLYVNQEGSRCTQVVWGPTAPCWDDKCRPYQEALTKAFLAGGPGRCP